MSLAKQPSFKTAETEGSRFGSDLCGPLVKKRADERCCRCEKDMVKHSVLTLSDV
jgi:hypothetical protein